MPAIRAVDVALGPDVMERGSAWRLLREEDGRQSLVDEIGPLLLRSLPFPEDTAQGESGPVAIRIQHERGHDGSRFDTYLKAAEPTWAQGIGTG